MAWNPSLLTTAGSEIRSGNNVNAAMTPMGFQINRPSTNRKRNRLQQPPIHHNNQQPSFPSHLALSDSMMFNSDVSTAWNDASSAPHSWLTSPNAPIMGHALSPNSTSSIQQPMQPTLSIPQLEYNTDVFCLSPDLGYRGNPIRQKSSLILPRAQGLWPRRCGWIGCEYSGTFGRKAELMRHVETIHVAPGAYRCPVCDMRFNRDSNMRSHLQRKH